MKIDFSKSIEEMRENFGFQTRSFKSFTFGDRNTCLIILKKAILASDQTIKDMEWLPEYDEVVEWMKDTKGKGLFLAGDVGRGKTNIVMHSVPLMFYHLKRKVVKTTQAEDLHSHLEQYKEKSLIAVDELGTEPEMNDYGVKTEPVSVLLDMAEAQCKTLFISTNYSSQQITARYGIRAMDRITRLCKVIKFNGKSLRK